MLVGMRRDGFTIVEIAIVITIMSILLVIGVVNLTNTEINGRDSERKVDIEVIALHLETFYSSGTDGVTTTGGYPSTSYMTDLATQQTTMRDIDVKNLLAPLAPSLNTTSLVMATNNIQNVDEVLPLPQASDAQGQYVYQPIQTDDSLCTSGLTCQKFNLYYMTEADNIVHMVKSKNQ